MNCFVTHFAAQKCTFEIIVSFDVAAQARCDEIVENILSGVNNLRSKCEQDITAHWKKFATVRSRLSMQLNAILSALACLPQMHQRPGTLFEC